MPHYPDRGIPPARPRARGQGGGVPVGASGKEGTDGESRLRAVVAGAPVIVFSTDGRGIFTLSVGRGLEALGVASGEMVGRSALELYADVEATDEHGNRLTGADALRTALAGQEFVGQCRLGPAVFDLRLVPQRDDVSGAVHGVTGLGVDVTRRAHADDELREARERLLLADRLAGIGTLAAGAAHEINNPLTYALINIEHVLKQLRAASAAGTELATDDAGADRLPAVVRALEQAHEGMNRVRGIVRNLLTFSHGTVETRTLVDLRGIVESSIQMAMHELVHRARVERELGETPPVDANEAALGQVFLNVLVNAAQAIPEGPGAAERHEVRVVTRTDVDGNAVVEVHDTGAGIPPEILPRIFDPFFTAKGTGKGTGLGLSISYATVKDLGGRIDVASALGMGTTFRVTLPPARGWRSSSSRSPAAAPLERRRILVVDDDPLVGEAIARVLEGEADVEVTTDARTAIERIVGADRWDFVFCDLMMPGRSGVDVYAEAIERAPAMVGRIVFMTAGAFTDRARAFAEAVPNACLQKPLDAEQVREIIRRRSRD